MDQCLEGMPEGYEPFKPFILWTDYRSPDEGTETGLALSRNAARLLEARSVFSARPIQGVDVMGVPAKLLNDLPKAVHVLGSPAPGLPDGKRSSPYQTPFTMKRDGFYSMMWHTPETAAIVMTYSASACRKRGQPRMDFWVSPIKDSGLDRRNLWVGLAHFESYRPSAGCHDDFLLADVDPDTMVAIYAPPSYVKNLVFSTSPDHKGAVDLRLTVRGWLAECCAFPVVTYSAWTGELEMDLVAAYHR